MCVCVHALKWHGDAGNVIVLQLPKDGYDIVSYPARMLDRRTSDGLFLHSVWDSDRRAIERNSSMMEVNRAE